MNPEVQSQILNKIMALIKKIRSQLQEIGLSKQEQAQYFALKIFKTKYVAPQQQNKQKQIKIQLERWLVTQSQKRIPVKESLIELLMNLEIENELIIQYENFEPSEHVVALPNHKKESQTTLLETPSLRKRQVNSFWERLKEDQNQVRAVPQKNPTPQFTLLRDFEKQLNESLMKTKMLKRLIQQKISEELSDSYINRSKQLHNMLALQSN